MGRLGRIGIIIKTGNRMRWLRIWWQHQHQQQYQRQNWGGSVQIIHTRLYPVWSWYLQLDPYAAGQMRILQTQMHTTVPTLLISTNGPYCRRRTMLSREQQRQQWKRQQWWWEENGNPSCSEIVIVVAASGSINLITAESIPRWSQGL